MEYETLGDITARAYLDDGLLTYGEDDPYLARLRDVAGRAAAAEVLVAVLGDGRVVGGVTFAAPGSALCDIARADEAEFRMLAVAREGRGRGAGEALVRACVDRARALEGYAGSCCRPPRTCRPHTGSTSAWASYGRRIGTGSPSPNSVCSRTVSRCSRRATQHLGGPPGGGPHMYARARCRRRGIRCESGTVPQRYERHP